VILDAIFGTLATLSFVLLLWQWLVARRFPLHERVRDASFAPAVTLLKPLKGGDASTADCLRSWLAQPYAGEVQTLLGVASETDPACAIVREVLAEFPGRDAQLVICREALGANAKVSTLIQLQRLAKHGVVIVSDADVKVPAAFLANVVALLREPAVGLVSCFYRLANPATRAMQWEAVAINADFWSQVLQSRSLKPLDFALGAVMAVRREALERIGGFAPLADYLADDYQLGHHIARAGWKIELCPVVVECWSPPMSWAAVWQHQLRWARTIRVCQPAPYFFSILSNATLWPLTWTLVTAAMLAIATPADGPATCWALPLGAMLGPAFLLSRILLTQNLQSRMGREPGIASPGAALRVAWWLVPLKDLLQAAVWLSAFVGSEIQWRGERYRLTRDGRLAGS
jgi:ceramide glucosyltransferase